MDRNLGLLASCRNKNAHDESLGRSGLPITTLGENIMSFGYGINRLLDLQGTNFQVFDMDVKEDKITYTIKHKDPAQYICKHCGHIHNSYHDKEWIHVYDLPLGNRKVVWKVERMRVLCHCQMGYRVEQMSFKNQKHFLTQRCGLH